MNTYVHKLKIFCQDIFVPQTRSGLNVLLRGALQKKEGQSWLVESATWIILDIEWNYD